MSTQNLTYKFTLDTFKNGVQRVVQGLNTGEHVARKMEITLVSAGEAFEIPFNGIVANMYVKRPSQSTPSINPCSFDATHNKILYTLHDADISEAGLVEMQLKLIDTRDGDSKVLVAPKFALEVWESFVDDSSAESTPEFTTLTDALAYIDSMKGSMISEIYIDETTHEFVVEYVDGTTYTTDALSNILALAQSVETNALKAEGLTLGSQNGTDVGNESEYFQRNAKYYRDLVSALSQLTQTLATTAESYTKGGTNIREDEETDNAKYYMEVCKQLAISFMQGGLIPLGTISFASLPVTDIIVGGMYNISDAFTTDSRFKEGAGHAIPAGANVYYTADEKWDVLAGISITINGKSGSSVTLNGADILMTGYSKPANTSAVSASDKVNEAIGKLEKAIDGKVNTVSGKGLSTNDYTNAEKQAVGYLNGFKFGGVMTESAFEAGQPYNDDVIRFTYKPTT